MASHEWSRSGEWERAWAKFVADNPDLFPVHPRARDRPHPAVEYARAHPLPDLMRVNDAELDALLKLVEWSKVAGE